MYRRSGAPRASVRGQRKIDQQQQSKKTPRTVIGVSSVPLSSRFTHLAEETAPRPAQKKQQHQVAVVKVPQSKGKAQPVLRVAGGKKKIKTPVPTKKQIQQQQQQKKLQHVAQNNRNKRQQVVSKHRKGLAPQEAKPKGIQNKLPKNKNAPAQQNGGGGAGRGGRGGRGARGGRGGRGGRGDAKAKPPTGEDLDMDMDEYWHEAGKGPDPKAVQLDRQMEEYWAAKPTQDNAAATKTEAEAAPDATMES